MRQSGAENSRRTGATHAHRGSRPGDREQRAFWSVDCASRTLSLKRRSRSAHHAALVILEQCGIGDDQRVVDMYDAPYDRPVKVLAFYNHDTCTCQGSANVAVTSHELTQRNPSEPLRPCRSQTGDRITP